VVVLVDGVGSKALEERIDTGVLGPVAWRARLDSGVPSLSRPAYHALLTGVPQQVSGIRHNSYARARADSVPARIHASGGKVGYLLEGVNWFHELFGEPGDPVFHGDAARDPSFLAQAFAEGASLVIVHLTRTDGAGHGHGAASPEYASEVRQAFDAIARLRAESAKLPGGSDVLWLVGADHGHTAQGGHGGPEREVRDVTWVALGPGVEPRSLDERVPIGAMAPTLAAWLGIPSPKHSLSDPLPLASAHEQADLAARALRRQNVNRALAERRASVTRAHAITAGIALLALALASRVLGAARFLASVAPTLAAIALFVALGPGITLSAVSTEAVFITRASIVATLGALVCWLVVRRHATWPLATLTAGVLPLTALAATLGSSGLSDASGAEVLLYPSTGLFPAAVLVGCLLVEGGAWWRARRQSVT
jgi:hypothetical protein